MPQLPLDDASGNSLTAIELLGAASLDDLEPDVPCPLSLVVVEVEGRVLMGLNAWRKEWELPGGIIEAGESPAVAALRELAEETGIAVASAPLVARVSFVLGPTRRREYAAVYSVVLAALPELTPNDELTDFVWWDPHADVLEAMSPLDAEIARHCRSTSS